MGFAAKPSERSQEHRKSQEGRQIGSTLVKLSAEEKKVLDLQLAHFEEE